MTQYNRVNVKLSTSQLNLHPTNIFYIQIVPTGVRLAPHKI